MVKSRVGSRFGSSCSGFSLLETLLTMSLIGAGALAALKLSISNVALETGNEKQAAANAVLQRVIEHIENESFDKIFAIFNYLPDDDPEGPGTAPGGDLLAEVSRDSQGGFDIALLAPRHRILGSAERSVRYDISISFPTHPDGRLSEDLSTFMPGMFGDLNRDGVSDPTADLGSNHCILPIRIEISWQGAFDRQRFELVRVLTRS